MNNGIQIIYPRSCYKDLNNEVLSFIQRVILEFMESAKIPIQENIIYTLDISHDEYTYHDYLTYIFYVSSYTGGAHPNHFIYSIVYDTAANKIIKMDDLVNKEKKLLSILSKESRLILENNPKIVNKEMLLAGTSPDISNFKTFAFGPTGIMIYFPEYQVAPYSSGQFKIVIPYSVIFNKEKDSN